MESVKTNEGELTSTMGNLLSSSKEEKNDASDSTPTSSTDAFTTTSTSQIAADDPISSTSSDVLESRKSTEKVNEVAQSSSSISPFNDMAMGDHSCSIVSAKDLLDMNITDTSTEKITENVDDIVQDLENLLGEPTTSFDFAIHRDGKRNSVAVESKGIPMDIDQFSAELQMLAEQATQTRQAPKDTISAHRSIDQITDPINNIATEEPTIETASTNDQSEFSTNQKVESSQPENKNSEVVTDTTIEEIDEQTENCQFEVVSESSAAEKDEVTETQDISSTHSNNINSDVSEVVQTEEIVEDAVQSCTPAAEDKISEEIGEEKQRQKSEEVKDSSTSEAASDESSSVEEEKRQKSEDVKDSSTSETASDESSSVEEPVLKPQDVVPTETAPEEILVEAVAEDVPLEAIPENVPTEVVSEDVPSKTRPEDIPAEVVSEDVLTKAGNAVREDVAQPQDAESSQTVAETLEPESTTESKDVEEASQPPESAMVVEEVTISKEEMKDGEVVDELMDTEEVAEVEIDEPVKDVEESKEPKTIDEVAATEVNEPVEDAAVVEQVENIEKPVLVPETLENTEEPMEVDKEEKDLQPSIVPERSDSSVLEIDENKGDEMGDTKEESEVIASDSDEQTLTQIEKNKTNETGVCREEEEMSVVVTAPETDKQTLPQEEFLLVLSPKPETLILQESSGQSEPEEEKIDKQAEENSEPAILADSFNQSKVEESNETVTQKEEPEAVDQIEPEEEKSQAALPEIVEKEEMNIQKEEEKSEVCLPEAVDLAPPQEKEMNIRMDEEKSETIHLPAACSPVQPAIEDNKDIGEEEEKTEPLNLLEINEQSRTKVEEQKKDVQKEEELSEPVIVPEEKIETVLFPEVPLGGEENKDKMLVQKGEEKSIEIADAGDQILPPVEQNKEEEKTEPIILPETTGETVSEIEEMKIPQLNLVEEKLQSLPELQESKPEIDVKNQSLEQEMQIIDLVEAVTEEAHKSTEEIIDSLTDEAPLDFIPDNVELPSRSLAEDLDLLVQNAVSDDMSPAPHVEDKTNENDLPVIENNILPLVMEDVPDLEVLNAISTLSDNKSEMMQEIGQSVQESDALLTSSSLEEPAGNDVPFEPSIEQGLPTVDEIFAEPSQQQQELQDDNLETLLAVASLQNVDYNIQPVEDYTTDLEPSVPREEDVVNFVPEVPRDEEVSNFVPEVSRDGEIANFVPEVPRDDDDDDVSNFVSEVPRVEDLVPEVLNLVSEESGPSVEELPLYTTEEDKDPQEDKLKEPLVISIDGSEKDKAYSPKITIKPIKPPEEEVSGNADPESSKGSLKMTITKQSDNTHSILKIYEPNDDAVPHEDESQPEPSVPKLIIKSIPQPNEQPQSPKISTRSSKQVFSPTSSQRSSSPRITIKPIPKPEDPVAPLKITIKPVLKSDETHKQKHSPKLTIKPIVKPDDEPVEVKVHSPRVTIKPLVKPVEEIEQISSPRITIKPIVKPIETSPEVSITPRLTIKPVVKPPEREKSAESPETERSNPKITIKPIVRPQEPEPIPLEDFEESIKERIVLKINKGTIPGGSKSKHQPEEEKLTKIKLKFSKEGGHPQIVQDQSPTKRPFEQPEHDKNKRQRVDSDQFLSGVTITPIGLSTHSKLKEMLSRTDPPSNSKVVTIEDDDDDVTIVEEQSKPSPIVISEESNQDSMASMAANMVDMRDPISEIPVFEITPDSVKTINPINPQPPPVPVPEVPAPLPPAPRKRGRPRKVPLQVREDFKDPKEEEPKPVVVESTRPKRSCRGQSVRTTLGIKPRKPRGGGRGRGSKRGMGTRSTTTAPETTLPPRAAKLSKNKTGT